MLLDWIGYGWFTDLFILSTPGFYMVCNASHLQHVYLHLFYCEVVRLALVQVLNSTALEHWTLRNITPN